MTSGLLLSIVVPTYNERENIPLLIWLIHQHLSGFKPSQCSPPTNEPWWEVVVVDDGSPDRTAAVVQHLQQDDVLGRNLKLVQRPGKQGLGTAYLAGIQKVCDN